MCSALLGDQPFLWPQPSCNLLLAGVLRSDLQEPYPPEIQLCLENPVPFEADTDLKLEEKQEQARTHSRGVSLRLSSRDSTVWAPISQLPVMPLTHQPSLGIKSAPIQPHK